MSLKDLGSYLIIPSQVDEPERYFHEVKHLEWILIAIRWLWVFILCITPLLYHLDQGGWMIITGGVLASCNILASLFNIKIKTPQYQLILGITILIVDSLVACIIILLFVSDIDTAAYLSFIYVIMEAAVRFGLIGSLVMTAVFALGLLGHYEYRLNVLDLPFSISSYLFWTILTSIIAISVGIIVQEGRRQRWQNEKHLKESTILLERNRIARELHDTVLKTLQGLSLEARALENRTTTTTPSVKETAQYIEEVCSLTSQEIREVILDLRTEGERTGIASQISKMVMEWSATNGITAEITRSGQDVVFPGESSRHLRNIVSEVLNNIRHHAAASHIITEIKLSNNMLDIEIRDNGRGIKRSLDNMNKFLAEGKLGIAGMKERTNILGGSLHLNSDQSGTIVTLSVPLTRQARTDYQ